MAVTLKLKKNHCFKNLEIPKFNKEEAKFIEIDETIVDDTGLSNFFEKQKERLWTDNELPVDLEDIEQNFMKLSKEFQTLIFSILLFFTVADKIVMGNLDKLKTVMPYKSGRRFLSIQNYIEDIHDKVYEKIAKLYYFVYYGNYENYINDQKLIELFFERVSVYNTDTQKALEFDDLF